MFGFGFRVDDENPGCTGCSFVADHFDAAVPHFNGHGVTLVAESISPLENLHTYSFLVATEVRPTTNVGEECDDYP